MMGENNGLAYMASTMGPEGSYSPILSNGKPRLGYNNPYNVNNNYWEAKTAYDNTPGLFGLQKGTWGDIGSGVSAFSGLAGMYTGLQQLGLNKDAFNFNKDMANKQYAMAKDAYDKNVARGKSISDQMAAGKVANV